jgi:TRAP-type C4-dicarboxylate transport system permease small subunit
MRRLSRTLHRALEAILAVLLAVLVLLVAADTLLWSLLSISYPQVAEIQSLAQIWFGLLAAAYGVKQGFHLGLTLLADRVPGVWRTHLGRVSSAAVAAAGLLLVRYGLGLTRTVGNTLPATGLPAAAQYVPAWVAGALIAFFALERLVFAAEAAVETRDGDDPGA